MASSPIFNSEFEEIAYWRSKFETLEKEISEVRSELEEFTDGSRELEAELETQLEQLEKKNKELKSLANRVQLENYQLKEKLTECNQEYTNRITDLTTELNEIRALKEKLHKYVRELEQQNDDLERAKRSTVASLEDFEIRMNAAIERNVYLESELDEKEALKTAVQRLKDETRDLRSELKILAPDNDKAAVTGAASPVVILDSNRQSNLLSSSGSSRSISPMSSKASRTVLAPSARTSALNIVGDLLRKVGALELKLVSCHNIVKKNSINGSIESSSSNNNNNCPFKIPRVASTSAVKDVATS